MEHTVDGAQRRRADEPHRDGDDVVADRNGGEADPTARILDPEVAVEQVALVQLVRCGGVSAKGVDVGLREAVVRESVNLDGIHDLVALGIIEALGHSANEPQLGVFQLHVAA